MTEQEKAEAAKLPPVDWDYEGHGWQIYLVCEECHGGVQRGETPCPHCGRRIKWDEGTRSL